MKKILIVDDDTAILEAMQLALEDEGFLVDTVADGNNAFTKCLSFNPDIILLDLLLSGKSGTEVIEILRSNEQTKQIPVILLSAHPMASQSAKDSGATDFLAKPFDVNELLTKVHIHTATKKE